MVIEIPKRMRHARSAKVTRLYLQNGKSCLLAK